MLVGCSIVVRFFFFQAEDGIRDLVRSRGLGDVYKRQALYSAIVDTVQSAIAQGGRNDEADLYGHPGRYVRQMHLSLIHI